ncbi:hypothetical protein [Marinomonas sp. FW-1]|uniref:hypothetical protein n=1 Tax=Marinomonas sp. FW-1 TaxID=2071621 RepID=UPI0010C15137|nr:hypothetical protein [Marinomonas sp. FW-1]
MRTFSLELNNEVVVSHGEEVLFGEINIHSFSEKIRSPISYWNRKRYLSQWRFGLNEIISGNKKSAIVTSMYDPINANFIVIWPLYLIEEDVFIQNRILFMEDLKEPFNESKMSAYIDDRETVNEDGEAISEWKVSISDIHKVLNSLNSDKI